MNDCQSTSISTSVSGGYPLRAYNSCNSEESQRKSSPQNQAQDLRVADVPDSSNHDDAADDIYEPTAEFNDGEEYMVLHFAGRCRIPIIQPSDIELCNPNWLTDSSTRSGAAMYVYTGKQKATGQLVALKRFKTYFDSNDKDNERGFKKYKQAMGDLLFELQILSTPSLRNHRNIVTLLGICFSEDIPALGSSVSIPILVLELAHPQYPDLSLYFNPSSNARLQDKMSFEVGVSFISDIADGIAAIHNHDLVHADLKPENVLLFPDHRSSNGLVAKISDFGFSGMTPYWGDVRQPSPEGHPRGGSRQWDPPECLGNHRFSQLHKTAVNETCRDVYSFGLLASFIALNGLYPRNLVENLDETKLSGSLVNTVTSLLFGYYDSRPSTNPALLKKFVQIIEKALQLSPKERLQNLDNVRMTLYELEAHSYFYEHPQPKVFHMHYIFPRTLHHLKCDGFYDAWWACPPSFRCRAYEYFERSSRENFGINAPHDPEVFAQLKFKTDNCN